MSLGISTVQRFSRISVKLRLSSGAPEHTFTFVTFILGYIKMPDVN